MTDHYARWRKRLEIAQQHATVAARRDALKAAGVMTYTQPELDDIGFYRLPLTEPAISKVTGQPNGRRAVIGYEPVAYYEHGGKLCGRVGQRDMSDDQIVDLWTHVVSNPIPKDWYRAVAERWENWPDAPKVEETQ